MRKAAHLSAPPAVVADMFANVRRWPAWMPGVRSVNLLEESDERTVALVRQQWMGREHELKWSFRRTPLGLDQEQLEGVFRRWQNHWQFLEAPDGDGTTVMVDFEFDLGLLGRITPARWIQDRLDRMFAEVIDKAEARARSILTGETVSTPMTLPEPPAVLEVLQSERGLLVKLRGRTYLLTEIED